MSQTKHTVTMNCFLMDTAIGVVYSLCIGCAATVPRDEQI